MRWVMLFCNLSFLSYVGSHAETHHIRLKIEIPLTIATLVKITLGIIVNIRTMLPGIQLLRAVVDTKVQ